MSLHLPCFLKKIAAPLFVCLWLFSCSRSEVFEAQHTFPEHTWNRIEEGKSVFFEPVSISDLASPCHIYVSFRHTPKVSTSKMRFIMRITSPSGIEKETVHTFALQDRDGKFIGNQVGDYWEIEELCKESFYFPETGEYRVEILNFMEHYATTGLLSMGIRVVKVDSPVAE